MFETPFPLPWNATWSRDRIDARERGRQIAARLRRRDTTRQSTTGETADQAPHDEDQVDGARTTTPKR